MHRYVVVVYFTNFIITRERGPYFGKVYYCLTVCAVQQHCI